MRSKLGWKRGREKERERNGVGNINSQFDYVLYLMNDEFSWSSSKVENNIRKS